MPNHTEKQTTHNKAQQALRKNISRQIMALDDWYELQDMLIQFPQRIASVSGISFLVNNQSKQNQFITAVEWWHKDRSIIRYPKNISVNETHLLGSQLIHKISAKQYPDLPDIETENSYCLPFTINGTPIGLLHLYFPESSSLTAAETIFFNELAPTIAFAIDSLLPETYRGHKELSVRRFAQYLHDTVGQNLGYLLLKLDELHSKGANRPESQNREILEIQHIANEAYEQVRDILTAMQPSPTFELSPSLYQMAIQIGSRQPTLQVKMSSEGKVQQLSTNTLNIVVAIFREAVINVVNHANADNIDLTIFWQEDRLTIALYDDGQGFSPKKISRSTHGMQIMLELATEIDAKLMFGSGDGTTISLHLPL